MPGAIETAVSQSLLFVDVAEQSENLTALVTFVGEVIFLNSTGKTLAGVEDTECSFAYLLAAPDALRFVNEILPFVIERGRWKGDITFSNRRTGRSLPVHVAFFTVPGAVPDIIVCSGTRSGADSLRLERQERMLEATTQVASDILASQTGIEALEHFAEAARLLTGARYAAIGVATMEGDQLEEFVTVGLSKEQEHAIGKRPRGAGVLGLLLNRNAPLRLDALSHHHASVGFPPNHPPMDAFLGVPIRHGNAVLGSLYLTEKDGGFDEVDEVTVSALGAHLAVAIRNLQMLKRQRALVSGLIAAQEEERRSVAYDLHDGLTQYVMAAQMYLSVVQSALEHGQATLPGELKTAFDAACKHLADSVIESRRLVNGLRSLALDDMGLAGALEQLIAEEKSRACWQEAEFTHTLGSDRFPQMVETALYRIAQEALTNVRKHAQADHVQVLLILQPGTDGSEQICLEVRDDGRGFESGEGSSDYTHIGLHGIGERVRLLRGQLMIDSHPGAGTRINVIIPVFAVKEESK